MQTTAPETPHRLFQDLARIFGLIILIPTLPVLAVIPAVLSQDRTVPYQVDPASISSLCGPDADAQLCREVSYTWRSGWRDWRAQWVLPETWIHQAIQESNQAASLSSRRSPGDDLQYWSAIYTNAARLNQDRVQPFARGFLELASRHELSRRQTLELVVGFVQNLEFAIPANYLQMYAPPRLLELGRGDCDTRALFLILVLNRMGFDAIMLLSPRYQHAMVGVLCASCQGARFREPGAFGYSFVETTARTPLGFLHPAVDDQSRWHALRLPLSLD